MRSPLELAKIQTSLEDPELDHLQRLMASWGMLSDLCFGDLLLFAPLREDETRFVVLGQVRPNTNRTLHRSDLIGKVLGAESRDLVVRAWNVGKIMDGELEIGDGGEVARVQCIPVSFGGRKIAVLSRESPLEVGRKWGELERIYVELFDRFARMILEGTFPFGVDEPEIDESPRVGDGILMLDRGGRVVYASPNAVNALHRVGVYGNTNGMRLDELAPEASAVLDLFIVSRPVVEEIDRPSGLAILFRGMPLIESGAVSGALVLLRDVSELRHRDRLLLSKEAAIREVHHRVKNNLQTISSLLSLQARRLGSPEGRGALREAERRIRSIAVVHEILAHEAGEQVPFDEAVASLVRMAEEAAVSSADGVLIVVEGDSGTLSADVATPLALVLAELLQNAVEHGFDGVEECSVVLTLHNDGRFLDVEVSDNGVGFSEGFSVQGTTSLGLSIVRDLIVGQLSGTIDMYNASEGGAVVALRIPIERPDGDAGN